MIVTLEAARYATAQRHRPFVLRRTPSCLIAVQMALRCAPLLLGLALANAQDASRLDKRRLDGARFEKKIDRWAEWVINYRNAHNCKGQVQIKDRLSRSLYHLARAAKGVLEVGAWRGCGSTLILAKGLIDQGAGECKLQTLEVDQLRAMEARRVLTELPVVNVTAAPAAASYDIYPLAEVKKGALPPGMRDQDRNEYIKWWHGEYSDAKKLEAAGIQPAIEDLCSRNLIDVAFLDGGEFFGLADLHMVLRHCPQLRYIALDDTQTFKNHRALQKLSAFGSGWELCAADTAERHGWAIVGRTNSVAGNHGSACAALTSRKATCHGSA